MPHLRHTSTHRAFTLIELLVVISIIALLISILLPSMSRARAQAKGVHCLARMKDMGNAFATYENENGQLPSAMWLPGLVNEQQTNQVVVWGWTELLYTHLYKEQVIVPRNFPVQRNITYTQDRRQEFGDYFMCKAAGEEGITSGHYRVYLPAWSAGTYLLEPDGQWGENTFANPFRTAPRESMPLKVPMLGDANIYSERGDGLDDDDCSYITGGEANYAGSDGMTNGNRFSDRHYGGTNFLFPDLHASWERHLRERLARDYDLNGIEDIGTPNP